MDAMQLVQLRMNGLYQSDATRKIRLSGDNPEIQKVYRDFLGQPLGEMSEKLLHVSRK